MTITTQPIVRAVFDKEGRPQGFYPEPIWTVDKVPPEAIEIPYIAYIELLEFQGRRRWNGVAVVEIDPTTTAAATAPDPIVMADMKKISAEWERIRGALTQAVMAWAGLENSLAHLLNSISSLGHLALVIYHTPGATETRIAIVDNVLVTACKMYRDSERILRIWRRIHTRIGHAKRTRNHIVHGNIASMNIGGRNHVRLTRPIFDMTPNNPDLARMVQNAELVKSGDTRLQLPGFSANDIEIAARNFGELSELCTKLRWPIIVNQMPNGPSLPSLHAVFRELEDRLKIASSPPTGASTEPEPSTLPPPCPE